METIDKITENKEERKKSRKAPLFSPGGQSTQLVIGASPEKDLEILTLADDLYQQKSLKRVYYSGYIPISDDNRLPVIHQPPLIRENRLYQADWLMRFYGFDLKDIVDDKYPDLDLTLDPKAAFALRNPAIFPIDINKADYEMILKVPGIGVKSAKKIISARKFGALREGHLRKLGLVWKRAKYFITCADPDFKYLGWKPELIREQISSSILTKAANSNQLSLFA